MTFILTPAAPTSSELPSFVTNDVSPQADSGPTFGPALSDARHRQATTDARRFDPSERAQRPDRPQRDLRPERADRADRPERAERPEAPTTDRRDPVADRRDDSTRTDRTDDASSADRPEASADSSDDTNRDVADEAANEDKTSEETAAAPAAAPTAPTDAAAAMAAIVHPTAKGAGGDGGPSSDPSLEAAASPDTAPVELINADSSVIDDGVTVADLEAMAVTEAETGEADVADMGRHAALTSLEQVSDANLALAERIQPATAEEVEGPLVLGEGSNRADALGESETSDTPSEAPMQGEADDSNSGRSERAAADTDVEPVMDDVAVVDTTVTVDEVDVATRPVQQTAIGTVSRTDAPDSVVVLAREATAVTETARTAATPAAPTPGPLEAAEANLWEDVRSAFDRIRSTGDGQEVRIRLRPAELGELLVQVRTQGEHVAVRLVASNAAAQQTLIDDRLRLAAELARAGFDEGSVDISQQNLSDSGQRGEGNGDGEADRSGRSIGTIGGLDSIGATRDIFEQRDPIRTDSGFRPGRTATSTISLTL